MVGLAAGSDPGELRRRAFQQKLAPLPEPPSLPAAQVALGKKLFYDSLLSKNGTRSCNFCHEVQGYGADNRRTSPGDDGRFGKRNSPTVYHAALHTSQFWDGRSQTLEEQAHGPVFNAEEMAMPNEAELEKRLRSRPDYVEAFSKAFPDDPDPLRWERVSQALAVFQRGLLTPSPFDDYLRGQNDALDAPQLRGLDHFLRLGCTECHSGPALGGQALYLVGRKRAYRFADRGRGEVTGKPQDNGWFKAPSLRNVAETAPYYHDGSVAHLDEAVRQMAEHDLGQRLSEQEVRELTDFLTSLTGRIPRDYVRP